MRKEYSDLPAAQKIDYIKRNIVCYVFMAAPVLVLTLVLLGVLMSFTDTMAQYSNLPKANMTATEQHISERDQYVVVFSAVLFITGLSGAIIGWIFLGEMLGRWIADLCGWYTDFELEAAERRVDQVKKKLMQSGKDGSKEMKT